MSHEMKPIPALADYCGDGNPVIVQEFRGTWVRTHWRERASVAHLRKLKREGATHIAVEANGSLADFAIDELLPKVGLRG